GETHGATSGGLVAVAEGMREAGTCGKRELAGSGKREEGSGSRSERLLLAIHAAPSLSPRDRFPLPASRFPLPASRFPHTGRRLAEHHRRADGPLHMPRVPVGVTRHSAVGEALRS